MYSAYQGLCQDERQITPTMSSALVSSLECGSSQLSHSAEESCVPPELCWSVVQCGVGEQWQWLDADTAGTARGRDRGAVSCAGCRQQAAWPAGLKSNRNAVQSSGDKLRFNSSVDAQRAHHAHRMAGGVQSTNAHYGMRLVATQTAP